MQRLVYVIVFPMQQINVFLQQDPNVVSVKGHFTAKIAHIWMLATYLNIFLENSRPVDVQFHME